jgi:hypothetical protein
MSGSRNALPDPVATALAAALGRDHRDDAAAGVTGGPAGNARLTAWLGLLLLIAFVVECLTLLRLGALVGVHIVVGVLLVALVIAKTGTTGWRIFRYYSGDPRYRDAGPPPLLLRVLGPFVVLGGLAVLGTGLALIALGSSAHNNLFSVGPLRVDPITLHQIAFVLWLVVTIPHTLGRLVPAVQLTVGRRRRMPARSGATMRLAALGVVVAVGAVAAGFVLDDSGWWTGGHHHDGDDGLSRGVVTVVLDQAAARRS